MLQVVVFGMGTVDVDEFEIDAVGGVAPPFYAADGAVDGVGGLLAEDGVVVTLAAYVEVGVLIAVIDAILMLPYTLVFWGKVELGGPFFYATRRKPKGSLLVFGARDAGCGARDAGRGAAGMGAKGRGGGGAGESRLYILLLFILGEEGVPGW